MKSFSILGASGAFFVLLLACGDTHEAGSTDAADGTARAAAADHGHNGSEAAGHDHALHAEEGSDRDADQRTETAAADTASKRLRPGLQRLETGVDLSQLASDDDVEPQGTVQDLDVVERQGARLGLDGAAQSPPQGDTGELPPGHATVLGEERHDFGSLVQGAHATHTFRLVSDGEDELVISRIKPSCGCTVANVSLVGEDGTRTPYVTGAGIPPGTEFEIETAFKSDGKQGRTKTQVAIYCNDPRSVLSLMLEADVQPVLVLEPRTLNLGQATSADQVKGTMRLSSPTLPPFAVEVDEKFVQPNMSVELVPLEPDAEGKAAQWDVHVTLGPELPEGMRNYPIRLTTDQLMPAVADDGHGHEQAPRHHFVIGYAQVQVQGIVSANPAYVPFGMVRPGTVVERVVRIECKDDFELSPDVPLELTALIQQDVFDYDASFTTRLDPVEGLNALDLTIRLEGLPDEATGSFGGMMRLDIGHPSKQELMVRFSGVCRPGIPPQGSQGSR